MSPFDQMAETLARLRRPLVQAERTSRCVSVSRTERIRQIVKEQGPISALAIACELDEDTIDSGRVAALLAADIRKGRIERVAAGYRLVDDYDTRLAAELQEAAALLRRHGWRVTRGQQ